MIDSFSENDSGDTKPWKAANIAPDTPPNEAPMREGQQLHVAGVDAHRLGGDFVFADGHPGAADARVLQAQMNTQITISAARRNR